MSFVSWRPVCHRCSKTFKTVATLKRHAEVCFHKNSEPRFQCEICSKRFRTEVQYTRHLYYTHSQRLYYCEVPDCGRSFSSQSHLDNHMLTHTSERPHLCPFPDCSYRARTLGRLKQHMLIHGEGKRFPCDYCEYSASTSSNLRRHARIHAGARPYRCPHCNHRTSELDALKKHVLNSGRHPGSPLYVCPWCQPAAAEGTCVGFNNASLAWKHMMAEHASELSKMETCKKIGRTPESRLLERDITQLLGIYCPEVDATQPPVNVAVRQPARDGRFRRARTGAGRKPLARTRKPLPDQTVPPVASNTDDDESTEQAPVNSNPIPTASTSSDVYDPSDLASFYNLIQIGSGALWTHGMLPQSYFEN